MPTITRAILGVQVVMLALCAGAAGQAECPPIEISQLTAEDPLPGAQIGFSAAMHGNTCVLGAAYDGEAAPSGGAAFIFDLVTETQLAKLLTADGAPGDLLGFAVAVNDDVALVGAPRHDAYGMDAGAAYVFERATGELVTKLDASGPAAFEAGWSIDLADGLAVVGAPSPHGTVTIFDTSNWQLVAQLTLDPQPPHATRFGWSVAISGDTIVVGQFESSFSNPTGNAYIHQRDHGGPDNWGLVKVLTASDAQVWDYFGLAVDIDGDRIVVGAPFADPKGFSFAGAAYVFERDEGGPDNWGEVAKLTATAPAEDDYFGEAVAVSGETIIVGCRYDDEADENAGAAYVYEHDEGGPGGWGLSAMLTASDAGWLDNFGSSVATDGAIGLVGALFKDGPAGANVGAGYLFQLHCTTCAADVDGDGQVKHADLIAVLAAWGVCTGCAEDVTGDGFVDVEDLVAVITSWGLCE